MSEPILGIEPKVKVIAGAVSLLICFILWFVPCIGCLAFIGIIVSILFLAIGLVEMTQENKDEPVTVKSKTVSVTEKKKK